VTVGRASTQEVPLPPKGLIRVQYTIADKIVILQRSPTNKLPACRVPMEVLFSLLDRENVSMLFTCILLEQKIIVYSEKISVLTVITESLLTLIFPFKVCANRARLPSLSAYIFGFSRKMNQTRGFLFYGACLRTRKKKSAHAT
jgi:hypothetical protein